ncbi:peptidylprolyl isomerase, partial [Acidobacteriota bacterium]
ANGGPHTNGSQFYITLGDRSYLDGDYTIFGHVVEGLDIVSNIQQGDVIESLKIVRRGKAARVFKVENAAFKNLVAQGYKQVETEAEEKKRRETDIIQKNWPETTEGKDGIKYTITQEGSGGKGGTGRVLRVRYTAQFLDGRKFCSADDNGLPGWGEDSIVFLFKVGESRINPGLDASLLDMRSGEKRTVILSPPLAFGTRGFYGREIQGEKRFVISPNTTLVYHMELLDITK